MKILKVTFKNLNSLKGENCIDFEKGILAEAGIFSITGPTGAGKSTILDALTLALFGKASRYESEANPEEVMTRGTGECFAEVEFACSRGRFRAKWARARARGKAEGKMQGAKREVSEVFGGGDGKILATRIRDADALIEDLTGLDYGRFLRSVLLAQGRFKEFLDASDGERGELLEKITGTEIYSLIGKKAYQLAMEKKHSIDDLQQLLQGLELKTEEQLWELKQQRANEELAVKGLEQSCVVMRATLEASLRYVECDVKLHQGQQDLSNWQEQDEAFAPQREAMKRHEATEPFREALLTLQSGQGEVEKIGAEIEALHSEHEGEKRAAGVLLLATRDFVQVKGAGTQAGLKKITQQREQNAEQVQILCAWLAEHVEDEKIDAILTELRLSGECLRGNARDLQSLGRSESDLSLRQKQTQQQLEQKKEERLQQEVSLQELEKNSQAATQAFVELAGERSLEQWRDLAVDQRDAWQLAQQVKLQRGQWLEKQGKCEQQQSALPDLQRVWKKAQILLGEKQSILDKEQQVLVDKQRILQQARAIASLQDRRAELQPDEACPLCGSEQHPYTEQLEISENEDQRAKDAQDVVVQQARQILTESSGRVTASEKDHKHAEQQLVELAAEVGRLKVLWVKGAQDLGLEGELEQAQIFEKALLSLQQEDRQVRAKIQRLEKLAEQQGGAQEALSGQKHALEIFQTQMQTLQQALQTMLEDGNQLAEKTELCQRDLAKGLAGFNEGLGNFASPIAAASEAKSCCDILQGKVVEYERQLKKRADIEALESELKHQALAQAKVYQSLREEWSHWQEKAEALAEVAGNEPAGGTAEQQVIAENESERRQAVEVRLTAMKSCADRLLQRHQDLQQRKADQSATLVDLQNKVQASLFENIEELKAARLPSADLSELKQQQEQLVTRRTTLLANIEQIKKQMTELQAMSRVEGEAITELQEDLRQKAGERDVLQQRLGKIELLLKQDSEAREQQAEQIAEIESLREEMRPWTELNDLIGQADGAKFSKYAQGLTLTQLLMSANHHLKDLNARYRIERSSEGELGLQMVDLYQGDAVRSTRSLSGGEGFLISLALALGLSDLAGRDTRIESLFIDEGFGTLDADTLDIALAALENLRMSHRSIGIISHVEALKQRISAQIKVSKTADGYGSLTVVNA